MTERRNTAGAGELVRHLAACDFDPPLAEQLDIKAYVEKLCARAERFECWSGGELAGLVAVYCNDRVSARAYVTMVSVDRDHAGRGIATRLLERAIEHCTAEGFAQVGLEVRYRNPAIALYRRLGFTVIARDGDSLRMTLGL